MQGIADHDPRDAEAPRKTRQGAQIFARIPPAFQRQDRLCGEAQFIGHGHADALRADVEAKIAGLWTSVQLDHSRLSAYDAGIAESGIAESWIAGYGLRPPKRPSLSYPSRSSAPGAPRAPDRYNLESEESRGEFSRL